MLIDTHGTLTMTICTNDPDVVEQWIMRVCLN